MSYNVLHKDEILNEGIVYIMAKYPYYNRDKLIDEFSDIKYSIQMLENCNIDIKDILIMTIFDALIGNSDRHHSNFGYVIDKNNNSKFSPLYDNGSSLCSYVNEEDIKKILKDNTRYNALINTKSKSTIGWNNVRPIRFYDLLIKLKENYYNETIDFIRLIDSRITKERICKLINLFDDNIINKDMKVLLIKFIMDRKNKIIDIWEE